MNSASTTCNCGGSSEPSDMKNIGRVRRLLMRLGLAQHQPDPLRLLTDIASLRASVHARVCVDDPRTKLHREIGLRYLTLACDAARAHDVASGYEYLHIADREAVFLMTRAERKVRAQSLEAEARSADKFGTSWRSRAILSLLEMGRTESPKRFPFCSRDDILPEALAEAVAHQNTLVRNEHRKTDKMRWQLAWLGFIVLVLVLMALGFAFKQHLADDLNGVNLLAVCIYLGLLGGFISSAITQRTADRKMRVPEMEVGFYAALARGALGAATSIPVYVLARSGLIAVGAPGLSQTWGVLFLCFFAGFSERWFLKTVTSAAPDDKRAGETR
ncbi:MAG: hypothetical protein J7605_03630 [Variovorax sp.]|nr:hypothetical protein [Variovorax sp.]